MIAGGRWCRALLVLLVLWKGDLMAAQAGPFRAIQGVVLEADLPDSARTGTGERHVNRVLAAALAVTLGPFGAHRIYLGSPPGVPLFYSLTFGGFGVLVLVDLGHILFTRDLSAYIENRRVLMWAAPREEPVTPP